MKTHRQINLVLNKIKPYMLLVLLLILAAMVWFVPPQHISIVAVFIGIATFFIFLLSGFTRSRRIRFIAPLFTFLFLSLNYFVGFELMNTILLISFIIAVSLLFKNQ